METISILVISMVVLFIAIFVFELMMLIDAIKNPRLTTNNRILWIVGMLLVHPFVAIVYYFVERRNSAR
jgi:hypothetical protein